MTVSSPRQGRFHREDDGMFVNKIKGLLLISVIEQVTTGINNKKHLKARKDFFIFIKFELAFVEQTNQKRSSLVRVAIYMRIQKKKKNEHSDTSYGKT